MKRIGCTAFAATLCFWLLAAPAFGAFGLRESDVTIVDQGGSAHLEAGLHPYAMSTSLAVETLVDPEDGEVPVEALRDLRVQLPPGFVGNPTAVPACSLSSFLEMADFVREGRHGQPPCGNESAVGVLDITVGLEGPIPGSGPVYNVDPPKGSVLQLGFIAGNQPITLLAKLRDNPPYNAVVTLDKIPQSLNFYSSNVTIWGNPTDEIHDSERGVCKESLEIDSCPVGTAKEAFLTLPRSCTGPLATVFEADSWQKPGAWIDPITVLTHDDSIPPQPVGVSGCAALGFASGVSNEPTSDRASSPSGLGFQLDIDDPGLTSVDGRAQSDLKKAVVTLPEGVTLNPSAADGLAACMPSDLDREALTAAPGEGCPEAAKLGTVEVETPLLEGAVLHGEVFVAQPDDPATTTPGAENPFDSFIAMYMVIKDPQRGILIKLPGKVEVDAVTGRLVTTFGEPPYDLPQFPFSHLNFQFRSGDRAPLVMPDRCGTFETKVEFTPWANPDQVVVEKAPFTISSGPNGGPCPSGTPPLSPGFSAGTVENGASRYSPYVVRITRGDGEQQITRLSTTLPPGVLGKIAGVERCSDAAIAAAASKTGKEELAAPSCPAGSKVGEVQVGAGVGNSPIFVSGNVYLAGPMGGDPFSVAVITPAVVGPFDAGNVVVRQALAIDPVTGLVTVGGSSSDPFPRILKGIPVQLRDTRVQVNRPDFMMNATSCEPEQAKALIFGSFTDPISLLDDQPVAVADRYQAADCASLSFRPKLSFRMSGKMKRTGNPAIDSTLKFPYPAGPGHANVAKAIVKLPPSLFIDNSHINNPCTRVQFNADACPPKSVIGKARASTPLLDNPLQGNVYLRSNGGDRQLPDIVADLHGEVRVTLIGYLDSVGKRNPRTRVRFVSAPDAPVSSFSLKMFGGTRGLLENSLDLCKSRPKIDVEFTGQNGRRQSSKQQATLPSCKKKRPAKRR